MNNRVRLLLLLLLSAATAPALWLLILAPEPIAAPEPHGLPATVERNSRRVVLVNPHPKREVDEAHPAPAPPPRTAAEQQASFNAEIMRQAEAHGFTTLISHPPLDDADMDEAIGSMIDAWSGCARAAGEGDRVRGQIDLTLSLDETGLADAWVTDTPATPLPPQFIVCVADLVWATEWPAFLDPQEVTVPIHLSVSGATASGP